VGPDATDHHFTGQGHDTESGMGYFAARYYQSQTGLAAARLDATPAPVPSATCPEVGVKNRELDQMQRSCIMGAVLGLFSSYNHKSVWKLILPSCDRLRKLYLC
jgi:hypothetical protein